MRRHPLTPTAAGASDGCGGGRWLAGGAGDDLIDGTLRVGVNVLCFPQSIDPSHSTRPHDHAPRPLTMAAAINSRVAFGDKVAFKHNEALTTGTGEATRRVGASAAGAHSAPSGPLRLTRCGKLVQLAAVSTWLPPFRYPACRGTGGEESRAARATSRRTRRLQPMLPTIHCSAAQRRSTRGGGIQA